MQDTQVKPSMDNSQLHRLPPALLVGTRFRLWAWGRRFDPNTRRMGPYQKRPWSPDVRAGKHGMNVNGHVLVASEPRTVIKNGEVRIVNRTGPWSAAMTAEEARQYLNDERGFGLVTGPCLDAFPIVVLDFDWKGHNPDDMEEYMGVMIPKEMYYVICRLKRAGAYIEVSPSGKGLRAILAGMLPAGHATRFHLKTLKKQEIYSIGRWLTLTGNNGIMGREPVFAYPGDRRPDSTPKGPLWQPDEKKSQEFLDAFYAEYLQPKEQVKKKAVARRAAAPTLPAVSPKDAPMALAAAMKDTRFRKLWTGEDVEDHSQADFALCCKLAGVFAGNAEQIDQHFRMSALMRGKWDEQRGVQTYGQRTIGQAIASWDRLPFPRVTESTVTCKEVQWSAEQREQLLFDDLNTVSGRLNTRQGYRATLQHLFDQVDAGEFHVADGMIIVHAGSLENMRRHISGDQNTLDTRLTFLARSGFIAHYSRQPRGVRIGLCVRAEDCPALGKAARGEDGGEFAVFNAVRKTRQPRQAERAQPAQPRAPRVPQPLRSAQWTAYLLARGYTDAKTIAAKSGSSVRSVNKHLQALERAGLTGAGYVAYREARAAELAAAQARTRARREREKAEFPAKKEAWLLAGREAWLARKAQEAQELTYTNATD